VTVTLGSTTFDNVDYDSDADVLYLHIGNPAGAVDFDESPEGHGLRFDRTGRLIGVTVVGARELGGDSHLLVVTISVRLEIDPKDLAGALAPR
jgi:uncharacterized protein YuzE